MLSKKTLMDVSIYLWLIFKNWGSNYDYVQLDAMVGLVAIHDESMKRTIEEKRFEHVLTYGFFSLIPGSSTFIHISHRPMYHTNTSFLTYMFLLLCNLLLYLARQVTMYDDHQVKNYV